MLDRPRRHFGALALCTALLVMPGAPVHAEKPDAPRWRDVFSTEAGGRPSAHSAPVWRALSAAYRTLDLRPPIHDARLSAVAAEIAELLAEEGDALADRAAGRISFELWRRGVATPSVHPIAVRLHAPPTADDLGSRIAGSPIALRGTHAGVAVVRTDEEWVAVVLVAERRATLARPFPLRVVRGTTVPLEVKMHGAVRAPRMVFGAPGGDVVERPLTRHGRNWRTEAPFLYGPGEYRVEVMADGAAGPEVVLLFPVYVEVAPPPLPTETIAPVPEAAVTSPVPVSVLEGAALALINAERRRFGLPPVTPIADLSAVARRYAEEVRGTRRVAHVSSLSGTPADRIAARGLRAARVTENIGRGGTIKAVHAAFLGSPAHRANILDRSVSVVGIGVAADRHGDLPVLYVNYVFASGVSDVRDVGSDGRSGPSGLIWDQLDEARRAAALPLLLEDAGATRAASDHASAMLAHGVAATHIGGISLFDLLHVHGAMEPETPAAVRVFSGEVIDLGRWDALRLRSYDRAGVGVAARTDRASVYVAVALLGSRR